MNGFKNTALVIANGEFPYHKSALAALKQNWKIICVDGATDKLKALGKEPDIVIGDFDSTKIQKTERTNLWIETPNQNKTDLEKTFEWCVKNQIKEIVLLGAGGQREDHLLGNLFLVSKFYNDLNIEVVTNYSKIICVSGSKVIKAQPGQNISIIASEVVDNIKIIGLKYSLINKKLFPSSIAISNKAISSQFEIESTGKVFVFLNHIDIE